MSLRVQLLGTTFQNPVLLAAGTCGFGRELEDVLDLEALGGLVTKSVTLEPRAGNPALRVSELPGGMLNSVGLANPGLEVVRREKLPWLSSNLSKARVIVSVAGNSAEEYVEVLRGLDDSEGFVAFELNLSCPNDNRLEGLPFALDEDALRTVVSRCRACTTRPLIVKLAPNDPRLPKTAKAAADEGADALTLVNTLPGLALDPLTGRPDLGEGPGGVSGPALRPAGVRAVAEAGTATPLPLIGVGGIGRAEDALQYLRAGASLVQVGTALFARPRAALDIIRGLERALGSSDSGVLKPGWATGTDAALPPRSPSAGDALLGRRAG